MLKKIIFFIILLVMFLLLIISAKSESRVFDEITHVRAGYNALVNLDFRYDPFNPPLARELIAVPIAFNNNLINDPILFWPRFVAIIFTILLGVLVYNFSKKLYGEKAALFSLLVFAIEPNILANGHYAQSDLIFTFFFILSLYLYFLWRKSFSLRKAFVFGAIIGLLLSTKLTSILFFFPTLIILLLLDYKKDKILNIVFIKRQYLKITVFILSTVVFLWATYFFTFEPLLGLRFDKNRPAIDIAKANKLVNFALYQPVPLGSYISTIKQQFVFNYTDWYRKDSMILGEFSRNGQSGFLYLPLMLIKIPWELLAVFFASLYLLKKKIPKDSIILVPIAVIILSVLFTKNTIVLRYILPIIPLMIIYSSQIINLKFAYKKMLMSLLIVLLAIETFSVFPHFTSYVNLSLGGYKSGYKYVFDSNYDWGQGLISLRKYQKQNNINNLKLAYFGDVDPKLLDLKYDKIYSEILNFSNYDLSKMEIEKNSTYAISATGWYIYGYYKLDQFKESEIDDIVGKSILIFKF